MKAVEAKRITEKNLSTKVPKMEYDSIKTSIEFAISLGYGKTWTDDLLHEVTINKLKSEGYKVKKDFFGDGYTISWK